MEVGERSLDNVPHIQQYLQFRSEFMGYLYAMTRDFELAEEIYQNAAVVVIEQAEKPDTIHNFRAWAKEVIRRQALYALRAKGNAAKHTRFVSPELLDVVSNTFLEDDATANPAQEEARALRQCLEDLTDRKRNLIAMRYENSASFDEISERVGSTPAAVQRALSRIRKMLHRCVERRLHLAEEIS